VSARRHAALLALAATAAAAGCGGGDTVKGGPPAAAGTGKSSFGKEGYGGPCPPKGDQPHHYNFLLYALRARLGLAAGASPGDVRSAVAKRALARGTLTGRFGR
jgi:phosphatidylethanolamine-binding protein (PEBP) family uncharacterized protein